MSIIYTHRGFPTEMDIQATPGSVYEAPEVSDIYRDRMDQSRPGFAEETDQIAILLREWKATQGFFIPSLMPNVRLGTSVQAFIAESALFLTKRITRRRVSFQDRALIMKHDIQVATRLPVFSAEEREAIVELANLTPEALIQKWVVLLGVDDLSCTMELYVGDRSVSQSM
jgi:hypothetical protein